MAKHIALGTPTQVAHPIKTSLRTAVAFFLAGAAFLTVAIPVLQEIMGPYLPGSWAVWLTGAVAFIGALATLVTRLMALARAQGFLAKIGLGTGVEKEKASPLFQGATTGELAEYPIGDPREPTSAAADRYEADTTHDR